MSVFATHVISTGELKGCTADSKNNPKQSVLDANGWAVKQIDTYNTVSDPLFGTPINRCPSSPTYLWNESTLDYDFQGVPPQLLQSEFLFGAMTEAESLAVAASANKDLSDHVTALTTRNSFEKGALLHDGLLTQMVSLGIIDSARKLELMDID